MKRYSILAVMALSAILSACSQERPEEVVPDGKTTELVITASLEESRVNLDGYALSWAESDCIAVYDGTGIRKFELVSGAGTKSASFSGEVSSSAKSLAAVYPYSAAFMDGGSMASAVPARQTPSAGGADGEAILMKADFSVGENARFVHASSLLRFSVEDGVSSVVFSSAGGPMLSSEQTVTLTLPGTAGEYCAAVNPGEYEGFAAFILKGGSWYSKVSENTLAAPSGGIVRLGLVDSGNAATLIRTPEEMSAFLKSSGGKGDADAYLLADIDMSAAAAPAAADYSGVFEGFGHRVYNISGPLFSNLHGSLRNLTSEGSVSGSGPALSALVLNNHGSIIGVCNKADVGISLSSAAVSAEVVGGIVAYNYGSIEDSSNEGTVSISSSSTLAASAAGGVAGYSEGPLKGLENSGTVRISALYGRANSDLGKISGASSSLGGIAGAAWNGNSISHCSNNGALYFDFSCINRGSGNYARCQIGGICGSPYGDIDDSHNYGAIKVSAVSENRTAVSSPNYIYDVGGISGGSGHQDGDKDKTSIKACSNSGDIVLDIDAKQSNSPIGGIVGWPNAEATSVSCSVSSCVNSGNITMTGAGKVRLGGIMGGTGSLEHCSNSGTVRVVSADSESTIGGIQGFHSQNHKVYACTNTGDVIAESGIWGVGGLIGCHGSVNLTSSAACAVDCLVSNGAADNSGTGMVLGVYNKDTSLSKAIVLGTPAEPIDVKGVISFGGSDVSINELSFRYYLCGTSYYSPTHVINAVCTVPAPTPVAEGYVRYSDGTAAVGVGVSDGFTVALTDASGHYSLQPSSDARYIYISLPADAKIAKKANGNPDFYQKYEYPASRYDFELVRQAKETRFLLFAMADPQAHYAVRGDQPLADTKRFAAESVPAINAHIASQSLPCYGVTLGDIVYSEGNRNSNPGLSEMAGSFGRIDMPVFQTMGNHDYTYFYTSSPLAASPGTSSLYLQAQRSFEDTFGPINFSFNRGDVHVVCMRNINYDSNTDASSYHCGYTDEQYAWLQADLAAVPASNMVIICGHIPLLSNTSGEHVKDVLNLLKRYKAAKIFSGHTHYKRYSANVGSSGIAEHVHGAVCGQWWWSNIQGDGCPNGYYVYDIDGTTFKDEYFMGVNNHMNTRDYQMRVYRGNMKTGGRYAYFQWGNAAGTLMINVFNGDSRWKVQVYENGVLGGNASLMSNSRTTFNSVTAGTTYTIPSASSQDWWAIGYHIGVRGRGISGTSYYTSMFHMYTYKLKDPSASVEVVATDGYGNRYTTTEVFSTDLYYPDYVKQGNVN